MEFRSKKTLGKSVKNAIKVIFIVLIGILVVIAVCANTTINEKIYLFLIAVIFGLWIYVLNLKEENLKLKRIIKLKKR
jgi:Flp pilus assembly protein TadB